MMNVLMTLILSQEEEAHLTLARSDAELGRLWSSLVVSGRLLDVFPPPCLQRVRARPVPCQKDPEAPSMTSPWMMTVGRTLCLISSCTTTHNTSRLYSASLIHR